MNTIYELYKKYGINLTSHNEVSMYALSKSNALKFLELAEKYHIMILGVDILYKNISGKYNYLTEPEKYLYWELSNLILEDRILFLKKEISNYNVVVDIDNIAFVFIDKQSFEVYDLINGH
jgi:hypothetical protein